MCAFPEMIGSWNHNRQLRPTRNVGSTGIDLRGPCGAKVEKGESQTVRGGSAVPEQALYPCHHGTQPLALPPLPAAVNSWPAAPRPSAGAVVHFSCPKASNFTD